jgi:hypothetical protein
MLSYKLYFRLDNLSPYTMVNGFDFEHLLPIQSDSLVLENSSKGGVGRFVNDCWGRKVRGCELYESHVEGLV